MVIFICKDDFDSILCGVYDAWMSRLGHDNVRLQLQGAYNMELFAKYRDVQVTEEKVDKLIHCVLQNNPAHGGTTGKCIAGRKIHVLSVTQ